MLAFLLLLRSCTALIVISKYSLIAPDKYTVYTLHLKQLGLFYCVQIMLVYLFDSSSS